MWVLSERPSEGHLCDALKRILPFWQPACQHGKLRAMHSVHLRNASFPGAFGCLRTDLHPPVLSLCVHWLVGCRQILSHSTAKSICLGNRGVARTLNGPRVILRKSNQLHVGISSHGSAAEYRGGRWMTLGLGPWFVLYLSCAPAGARFLLSLYSHSRGSSISQGFLAASELCLLQLISGARSVVGSMNEFKKPCFCFGLQFSIWYFNSHHFSK